MKPKTIYAIIALIFSILILNSHSSAQSQFTKDKFYIGTFNFAEFPFLRDGYSTPNYNALSLNLMQGYGFHYDTDPYSPRLDGGFNDSVDTYSGNINDMLS